MPALTGEAQAAATEALPRAGCSAEGGRLMQLLKNSPAVGPGPWAPSPPRPEALAPPPGSEALVAQKRGGPGRQKGNGGSDDPQWAQTTLCRWPVDPQ
mmetsp:Transcript_58723/g.157323  ORF Transcript_58723/g.157323 Transcript_58723/m.157323 type:complete len:98 (+) Transcript_58723:497-790(+)